MRRLVTFALALGLAALVALAAVDALRQPASTEPRPADEEEPADADAPEAAAWIDGGEAIAERLARLGVTGTLYLSPDRCRSDELRPLRTLSLPELAPAAGPELGGCAFSLSADGHQAAGEDAVWSPRGATFAAETGTAIALVDARRSQQVELEGTVPAFTPNGTLTSVRQGSVVEWTSDCEAIEELVVRPFTFTGEQTRPICARELLSSGDLAAPLPDGLELRAVERLLWLGNDRAVALLQTNAGPWVATYGEGRPRAWPAPSELDPGSAQARPGGDEIAVLADGYVTVYEEGREAWSPSLETRAFGWSPDGEWLAYATDQGVYVVRSSDWTTQFRLRVSTRGLAWR